MPGGFLYRFESSATHPIAISFLSTVDVNECASNPCFNGRLCIDGQHRFTCDCGSGYQGSRCENGQYSFSIIESLER